MRNEIERTSSRMSENINREITEYEIKKSREGKAEGKFEIRMRSGLNRDNSSKLIQRMSAKKLYDPMTQKTLHFKESLKNINKEPIIIWKLTEPSDEQPIEPI